jgi:hypothetical protein
MQKKISEVQLDGFTVRSVSQGELADMVTRDLATSESPRFFVYAEQIANLIFPKLGVSNDKVDRYLMVLHPDNTADVYLQDFKTVARARLNRPMQAGEAIFRADITEIDEVRFPDSEIVRGDRMVFFERRGWRFGLAFDFTRKTDADLFAKMAADLQRRLLLDDILQITLTELREAEQTGYDAFVITEGKTDWRHLQRALGEIGYRRKLRHEVSDKDRGDKELLAICRHLALEPRDRPVICVFDRDNESVVKELAKLGPVDGGYQDWGNGVYSLLLPVPEHRKQYKNISIELYYSEEVLGRRTADGKKLCFDNELRTEILPGNRAKAVLIAPDPETELAKKAVASIDRIEDAAGNKVGLSKAAFAELIRNRAEPFQEVDFGSFRLLADAIERIIDGWEAAPPG